MDFVRFAIIGIGRMGSVHAENIVKNRIKGAKLVAVCDLDEAKLSKFKAKHKSVAVYSDYHKLLETEKPDAVMVATPHYSHVRIVCDCLGAGANVISEKPASVTVGEAQKAIDAAKATPDLTYGIMYNQRTNPVYKYVRNIVKSGALGYIKRVNLTITSWYRSQFYYNMGGWRASWQGEGGGVLINQCVHQLDILQWIIGMPAAITAWAEGKHRDITVENDVAAVMEYKDDFKCTFVASGHELHGTNLLEIAGDKGKLIVGEYGAKYLKFDKSETEVNASTAKGYGNTKYKIAVKRFGLLRKAKEVLSGGQQANILRNFTNHLLNGEELIAKGEEGINALSIINAIYLSAANGSRRVTLPLDPDEYEALVDAKRKEEANK